MCLQTSLVGWGFFNLLIGIWEIYAFLNRNKLVLENVTIWEKIKSGNITIGNFWLEAWNEYCKVDSRYIIRPYVWTFELLNALIAFIFIFIFILGFTNSSRNIIKILLLLIIINCVIYFISLGMEILQNDKMKQNIAKYSKQWMLLPYYLISSIWLFIPFILLSFYNW
jgi:hypothetical protein